MIGIVTIGILRDQNRAMGTTGQNRTIMIPGALKVQLSQKSYKRTLNFIGYGIKCPLRNCKVIKLYQLPLDQLGLCSV